jgi:hypothetical protein
LLIAARNPSANRSLIAFTAWSSFAHALVMAIQAFQNASNRGGLLGAAATFVVIGGALIVLAPGKQSVERKSAAPVLTSWSSNTPWVSLVAVNAVGGNLNFANATEREQ